MTSTGSIHGNGTIAQARSVSSSVVHHGMSAPIADTIRAYSANASAATTSATVSNATGVRNQMAARAAAASDTPLRMRVIQQARLFDASGNRRGNAAVTTIALLVRERSLRAGAGGGNRASRSR